ncbi:MAG: hypothetical protein E7292_03655 [Lachnospiraceae bacterium]|nr:hypothetical protein [Lachnospiraceae bacterium]
MNRRKYWLILLGICMCMSATACGRNKEDIYDKYQGVTEGEGGMNASIAGNKPSVEREMNYDTVGGGVSVFTVTDSEEDGNNWYPNVDVFLMEHGFLDSEPFYEYTDINGHQLVRLYYNPDTREGCGVRYYSYPTQTFPEADGIFGFVFTDVEFADWTGYNVADYMALTSVYGGDGSQSVNEYDETVEYDEYDRVTLFESKGIVPELVELGVEEAETILHIEYDYYEDGGLKSREYSHSAHIFPTSMSSLKTQFDEQERVVYEQGYITHGSLDYFYIYEGNSSVPKYCLTLDFMNESWMPVLVEYNVEEVETGETKNAIHFD